MKNETMIQWKWNLLRAKQIVQLKRVCWLLQNYQIPNTAVSAKQAIVSILQRSEKIQVIQVIHVIITDSKKFSWKNWSKPEL